MAEATEVGFIYQCVLCGSFAVWAVDALDRAEVSRRAGVHSTSQKTLQKDVHAVEEELLEEIQRRLCPEDSEDQTKEAPCALLPCSSCIEISEDRLFAQWLDDRSSREKPVLFCPHIAVTFEEGQPPPAYIHKAGKWCLAQGVGPKDLEMKLPFQLPSGQFRTLLPPAVPSLRPPCWQKKGTEDQDSASWEDRRYLLERFLLLVSQASQASVQAGKKAGDKNRPNAGSRAPAVGQVLPFVSALLVAAEEVVLKENSPAAKCLKGEASGRYVRVPLLAVTQAIGPLVESELEALEVDAA